MLASAQLPGECYQPRARSVALTGATLRIAEAGSGQPLLLVNGIGAGFQTWWPFARRLSQSRRLIMFDAPGIGGSRQYGQPLRMPGLAQLLAELCDALGQTQVDVLGYSWGGALAQQFAHDAPQRVRRLVLASTSPGLGGAAALTRGACARVFAVALPVQDVPDPLRAGHLRRGVAPGRRPGAARTRAVAGLLAKPHGLFGAAVRDQLVDESSLAAPRHRADPRVLRYAGSSGPGAERSPARSPDPPRAARADTTRRPSVDARASGGQRRARRRIPLRLVKASGRGRTSRAPGGAADGHCCRAARVRAPRLPSARWSSQPRPPTTSLDAWWPT